VSVDFNSESCDEQEMCKFALLEAARYLKNPNLNLTSNAFQSPRIMWCIYAEICLVQSRQDRSVSNTEAGGSRVGSIGSPQRRGLVAQHSPSAPMTVTSNEVLHDSQFHLGTHAASQGYHQEHVESPMGSVHTIETEEKTTFTDFINACLAHDGDLDQYLPIRCDGQFDELAAKLEDGYILHKLVLLAQPNAINSQHMHKKPNNLWKKNENLNLLMDGVHKIGLKAVNIGAEDIGHGR
jgi:hypothetical protein